MTFSNVCLLPLYFLLWNMLLVMAMHIFDKFGWFFQVSLYANSVGKGNSSSYESTRHIFTCKVILQPQQMTWLEEVTMVPHICPSHSVSYLSVVRPFCCHSRASVSDSYGVRAASEPASSYLPFSQVLQPT